MTAPAPPSAARAWQKASTSRCCASQPSTSFFSTGSRPGERRPLPCTTAQAAQIARAAVVKEFPDRQTRFVPVHAMQVEFCLHHPASAPQVAQD
jgi:hypothetical protein